MGAKLAGTFDCGCPNSIWFAVGGFKDSPSISIGFTALASADSSAAFAAAPKTAAMIKIAQKNMKFFITLPFTRLDRRFYGFV
jgi:hypothetical protein